MEDISMYMIRNPMFDAQKIIFDQLLLTKFDLAPKALKNILIGRSLWCMLAVTDLVRMHEESGKDYVLKVVSFTADALSNIQQLSLQLIALKTLVKFVRKLKPEDLSQVSEHLEKVIHPSVILIDRAPLDCLYLPIEAFALFSKL